MGAILLASELRAGRRGRASRGHSRGRGEQFLEGPADMGQEQLAVDTNWPGTRGALGPTVHQRAV